MKFFQLWKMKFELIDERDKANALLNEEVVKHERTKKELEKIKQTLSSISDHRSELLVHLKNSRHDALIMTEFADKERQRADKAERIVNLLNSQLTQRVGHLFQIGEMILNQRPYHQILQQLADWAIPVAASGGVVTAIELPEDARQPVDSLSGWGNDG